MTTRQYIIRSGMWQQQADIKLPPNIVGEPRIMYIVNLCVDRLIMAKVMG